MITQESLPAFFWENVDRIRAEKRLRWKDVAEKSGHSIESLSSMRSKGSCPSLLIAARIAKALEVSIDSLVQDSLVAEPESSYTSDMVHLITSHLDPDSQKVVLSVAQGLMRKQEG